MLKAIAQTPGSRTSVLWACGALGLAVVATLFLAWFPCAYRSEQSSATVAPSGAREPISVETVSTCSSMWEVVGGGVVLLGAAPIALAAAGLLAAVRGRAVPQVLSGVVVVSSAVLSGIFVYFAPAGLALIVSGATQQSREKRRHSP